LAEKEEALPRLEGGMSLNKSKSLRTAEKYVLQGKIPAAIDEYRKVVDADPADMTTINTLGDLYVRAGRIPDAISNFSRIADSYRDSGFTLKAIAMLKKISKLDPTNIDTSMKLANLYSQQGLFVEARQQYLQVADAYARAGQTRKALDAYQKIADLDPSNTSVRIKLGEIYSREGLIDQAHEAFIMAGAEFMRKGDTEQALATNLKALAIRPEGRQALTAIVSIYTQQGQADRAINILCDAFDRNPGDVELLTILGRTYLVAGYMDDAERTFLSLVELDKNRYNYLLDVGRKFLQMGDLDRAAEQIDGCLDVLIAKREEDKGIDFLRRILERDMNHIGALKRLAQIFMRIREDHNLIATLNSLAEAAMRKGDDQSAIEVLKELARLEPDEQRHRQRLYNLGIRDITEPGTPDVIRATGPLDYGSAAFDDAFVIRQISEAEILAGHGQIDHAVSMLTEILNHAPENVQVHLKLKDIYLRASMLDKAASQCQELAQVYEARGEPTKATDCLIEAHQLNPLLESPQESGQWTDHDGRGLGEGFDIALPGSTHSVADSFEISAASDRLDLSRYETGPLTDQMGFVTAPPKETDKRPSGLPIDSRQAQNGANGQPKSFTFSDTFIDGPAAGMDQPAAHQESNFAIAGDAPADAMPDLLRDELDGIDFYIAQGYIDIAHDTLDRLREEHGDHPELLARYQQLGIAAAPTKAIESDALSKLGFAEPAPEGDQTYAGPEFDFSEPASGGFGFNDPFAQPLNGKAHIDLPPVETTQHQGGVTGELISPDSNGHFAAGIPEQQELPPPVNESAGPGDEKAAPPFMVYKESGPLNEDLLVRFNTSELPKGYTGSDSDYGRPVAPPASPVPTADLAKPVAPIAGTAELVASLISGMDDSLRDLFDSPAPEVEFESEFLPEEDVVYGSKFPPDDDVVAYGSKLPPERKVIHQSELSPEVDLAHGSEFSPEVDLAHESEFLPEVDSAQGSEFSPEVDLAHRSQLVPESQLEYESQNAPESEMAPEPVLESESEVAQEPEVAYEAQAPQGSEIAREPILQPENELVRRADGGNLDLELREMFEDLKGNTEEIDPLTDYETHYSLGLAYKDMELLDEAIEQFQSAFRYAARATSETEYIQCCHMLGVCFKQKAMPKLAVMWFSRGMKVPHRTEDEYQAMRFEIGLCYEEMGEIEKALDAFSEVYGIDVNYRHVSEKLKELQAAKNT
jgi:tetratricopeptide (TPR) repeat protein